MRNFYFFFSVLQGRKNVMKAVWPSLLNEFWLLDYFQVTSKLFYPQANRGIVPERKIYYKYIQTDVMSRMVKSLEGKIPACPSTVWWVFFEGPQDFFDWFLPVEMHIVVIFLVWFIQHSRTCANVFSVLVWSWKWVFGEGAIHWMQKEKSSKENREAALV